MSSSGFSLASDFGATSLEPEQSTTFVVQMDTSAASYVMHGQGGSRHEIDRSAPNSRQFERSWSQSGPANAQNATTGGGIHFIVSMTSAIISRVYQCVDE